MRVDCHVHVLPAGYRDALGAIWLPPAGLEDLEAMMERHATDAAVLSIGPPGVNISGLAPAKLARLANDGLAEVMRGQPRRFAALAALPLPDLDAALAELERAYDELSLDGVLLLTSVDGIYVGDRRWDALFDALEERSAYVFLHPVDPPQPPPLDHPSWLYELPVETLRAAANLVYSGTLERCPRIRLQLAHLGGAVPFLAHRLALLAEGDQDARARAPRGALEYLGRLYYDTGMANNAPALAATQMVTAPQHIVFGTDWPYVPLPDGDPAPGLEVLGAELRAAVEGENAFALVPRLRPGG
jgi:predicted TIM-barrel fold metal-dependent hydrolase